MSSTSVSQRSFKNRITNRAGLRLQFVKHVESHEIKPVFYCNNPKFGRN
jgi:hypothetical protein